MPSEAQGADEQNQGFISERVSVDSYIGPANINFLMYTQITEKTEGEESKASPRVINESNEDSSGSSMQQSFKIPARESPVSTSVKEALQSFLKYK